LRDTINCQKINVKKSPESIFVVVAAAKSTRVSRVNMIEPGSGLPSPIVLLRFVVNSFDRGMSFLVLE